jgi:hypothetical protein
VGAERASPWLVLEQELRVLIRATPCSGNEDGATEAAPRSFVGEGLGRDLPRHFAARYAGLRRFD